MPFSELKRNLRNERVIELLGLALRKGRLANSLLFIGPDGSGKREAAVGVAKALNCIRQDGDFCGRCGPCQAITKDFEPVISSGGIKGGQVEGRFPDVLMIKPEKGNIGIERIRFIKENAYLKPMIGRKRVFIIDEVEKMNREASNALLKVYEEPPADTYFILLTADPSLLLPTIVSRCQSFAFSRPPREEIEAGLMKSGCGREEAAGLAPALEFCQERAGDFDPAAFRQRRDEAWSLFKSLVRKDRASRFLEKFGNIGKEEAGEIARFVEMFCFFGRDLLILKLGAAGDLLINPELKDELRMISAGLTIERITSIIEKSDGLLVKLEGNSNRNLLAVGYFLGFGDREDAGNDMRPF